LLRSVYVSHKSTQIKRRQSLAQAASENFLNQDKITLSEQEGSLLGVDPAVATSNFAQ